MQYNSLGLTVLSYGGGQETTYLVYRLLLDPEFYKNHVKGKLIVVGSDTGNEHPHTYENIENVRKLCSAFDVDFFWITKEMGFHSDSWKSLVFQYQKNSSIGSARFQQTCTDNLKVKVVDRFVDFYIQDNFKLTGSRKKSYYKFCEKFGKIRLILGFSYEEESRIKNGSKHDPVWKRKNIERYYPLIEDGTTRQNCIDYLENLGLIVFPSNCMFCFYQSDQEILWLYRNYPESFKLWVELERRKLQKYQGEEKNFGVYGSGTLNDKLKKAIEKFGHLSNEELNEYKYSHGHCIKSKY